MNIATLYTGSVFITIIFCAVILLTICTLRHSIFLAKFSTFTEVFKEVLTEALGIDNYLKISDITHL